MTIWCVDFWGYPTKGAVNGEPFYPQVAYTVLLLRNDDLVAVPRALIVGSEGVHSTYSAK